jgi:hypothetical protein
MDPAETTVAELAELAELEANRRLAEEAEDRRKGVELEAAAAVADVFATRPARAGEARDLAGWHEDAALRLLCAWTWGKPAEADDVMIGLAVLTVDRLVAISEGRKT